MLRGEFGCGDEDNPPGLSVSVSDSFPALLPGAGRARDLRDGDCFSLVNSALTKGVVLFECEEGFFSSSAELGPGEIGGGISSAGVSPEIKTENSPCG